MVVGMQHQQQQPYASPATVLEDASTPCALSPQSPAAMPKDQQDRPSVDECSSTTSNVPCEPMAPDISRLEAATLNGCDDDTDDDGGANPMPSRGRVKLLHVNEHLICFLCDGYLVDATSITECLHTFCRSCIILHLATKNHCPKCEIEINNSKPHLSLKPDKTLQDIVYKLVPGLFHAEMKRRNRFYLDKPDRDTHLHPEFRGISVDRLVYSPHDTICLSLEYYDNTIEKMDWENVGARRVSCKPVTLLEDKMVQDVKDDYSVAKSIKHFKCPAAVRVMHLKKLIQLKYNVDIKHKVELFHRRESLPDDYSLMDIAYIYAWKRNSPLKLYYRISLPENDSEFLLRRSFLATFLEEKSSHSTVVVPNADNCDETKIKSADNCWRVKSPLGVPNTKLEPRCCLSSVVSGTNQTPKSKTLVDERILPDLPAISDFQEITTYSRSHDNKSSSISTTASVTLPSSKPKVSLTTTAVHTAPKVSSKLKYYSDAKKPQKFIKTLVPNTNLMTPPEKPSSNAIRSYLTISSILNEPEPKKLTAAKVVRSSTVVKEYSNDTKTLPAVVESSQVITESAVSSNRSVEPSAVPSTTTESASLSNNIPAVASPSLLTNKPKNCQSLSSPTKQSTINTSTNVTLVPSSEKITSKTAEPATKPPTPAPTNALAPSNGDDNSKSVPECIILTNTKSPINGETNVTSTDISSDPAINDSTVCSKTAPCSVPVEKLPQDHAIGSTASSISKMAVTNSTASSAGVKAAVSVVSSPVPSTPPPLITLKQNSMPKTSLPLLKPRPVPSSFILANTKIPSSLEISLTQSKDDRVVGNSPVLSLQKMVTQNFASNSVDAVAKCAIKRPFVDVEEPPTISISKAPSTNEEKKKLGLHNEITLTTNNTEPAKKIFSPNILPEVSITLNPHPDRPTKRITPETSFDVTCFKPSEKPEPATNGIPPLTPIATYSAGPSAICKNIQNSPIKNLNTKNHKNSQRNSFSPKNRPRPLLACDIEPKMCKLNGTGAGTELEKQTIENSFASVGPHVNGIVTPVKLQESAAPITCKPQIDVKPSIEKNSNCTAVSGLSGLKKKGSHHQSIPQLIDITTPRYTQLMAAAAAAQNAKMRSAQYSANNLNSALHIKLPPTDEGAVVSTGAALDLSSPLSCDKNSPSALAVEQSSESPPDKKKLIQSMPPLMIPVTMNSRVDSKLSPSAQSLSKIERRVSPIAKIDRKSDMPTTPVKGSLIGTNVGGRRSGGGSGNSGASDLLRSVPFSTNGHSNPSASISPSSKTSKTPPSNLDARRVSPSNSTGLLSPVSSAKSNLNLSPNFMSMAGAANYHATMLHLMQMQQLQQNWLSKVRDPVPPHPLMFDHSKPSTSQETLFNLKK